MAKQSKAPLTRAVVFPESELPDAGTLLAEDRQLANSTSIGACPRPARRINCLARCLPGELGATAGPMTDV